MEQSAPRLEVLRIVILNGITEWDLRWFYATVRSLCHHLWTDEVAHRATLWLIERVKHPQDIDSLASQVLGPLPSPLPYTQQFDKLYRHIYCFADVTRAKTIGDNQYATCGTVKNCLWHTEFHSNTSIQLVLEKGRLCIHSTDEFWLIADGPYFGFVQGYNWCYAQLLVGKRIQCIMRVDPSIPPRRRHSFAMVTTDGQQVTLREYDHFILTTDGMQFPFVLIMSDSDTRWSDLPSLGLDVRYQAFVDLKGFTYLRRNNA